MKEWTEPSVRAFCKTRNEPDWLLNKRLDALHIFNKSGELPFKDELVFEKEDDREGHSDPSWQDSEALQASLEMSLKRLGVIFLPMDEAVTEHPSLVERYFGQAVKQSDNPFATLTF